MSSPSVPEDFEFILSQTDGRPMYLQIMDQVQQRISLGDWQPGAKLPSIRELAVTARVSVITIKRAYLELERSGVIVTQQGRGSWVSESTDRDALKKIELQRLLEQATTLARSMGMTVEDLKDLLGKQAKY